MPESDTGLGLRRPRGPSSACRRAVGFRDRGGNSGIVPIAAWDRRESLAGQGAAGALASAITIRRSALSPPPMKSSIGATDRRSTPMGYPTIANGESWSGLTEMPRATIEDMQRLQYDLLSIHARDLAPVLLALFHDGPLKRKLADWDYQYVGRLDRGRSFSAFLSARRPGDFRPGARHRLAADALSLDSHGLFDDGPDGRRPHACGR